MVGVVGVGVVIVWAGGLGGRWEGGSVRPSADDYTRTHAHTHTETHDRGSRCAAASDKTRPDQTRADKAPTAAAWRKEECMGVLTVSSRVFTADRPGRA